MGNYIQWIREQVGHEQIFLNFAAAFILNERGEVLLQKRGDMHAWGLPGGALELGESAEEAMLREVFEETGLRVKVEAFLGAYTRYFQEYPNGDRAQSIAFFLSVQSSQESYKSIMMKRLLFASFHRQKLLHYLISSQETRSMIFYVEEEVFVDKRAGLIG